MNQTDRHVSVEGIDWGAVLPFTQLFRAFRQAVHPGKLGLALLLVVLLFIGGKLVDGAFGGRVLDDEILHYATSRSAQFEEWRGAALQHRERNEKLGLDPAELRGVFAATLDYELDAFSRMVNAAISLRVGLGELVTGSELSRASVLGALRDMFVVAPGWMIAWQPWVLAIYLLYALALWALLGGAIARVCALQACGDHPTDATEAVRFAVARWFWLFGAPLLPVAAVLLCGLVLVVSGLVFFNLPVLDIMGALLFFVFLFLGAVMTLGLVGLATGGHLLYPAIAVEGADGFDAIARAFNYVMGQPWRWLCYTLVALVYGAITYAFVGLFIFIAIYFTHQSLDLGVVAQVGEGVDAVGRFEAMFQAPRLGELAYQVQWDELSWSAKIAAALIWVWVMLLIALLPAFVISYYFTAHTWIYLLLRRSSEGAEFDEVYLEPREPDLAPAAADKTEPAAPAPETSAPAASAPPVESTDGNSVTT
jgi:hypothetical protein